MSASCLWSRIRGFINGATPETTARVAQQKRREINHSRVREMRSVLQPMGFTVVRMANPRDVRALLQLIMPVKTEHSLILIGGSNDGGYLVPDDLDGIEACFSPGVSDVADFELDLIQRSIPCFLADASVASSPIVHELLHFEPLWLGPVDDPKTNTISLDTWVARHAPESDSRAGTRPSDLLLQMDIEDAEWACLLAASNETLARFRIIVIEFHDLEALSSRKGLEYMGLVFKKLTRLFSVVHAHPNNFSRAEPIGGINIHPVIELTFLRRDRIATSVPETSFPHPLDAPNLPRNPDVVLDSAWYYGPPS